MTEPSLTRAPELLAPAGGPESLRAAVANGADAVYLGARDFNARRGAENFELASLAEHTRYAHLRDAKVYLTANVLVLQDEMNGALGLVADAWDAGVDAVIVQDLGLMGLIARELPQVRVHASTQVDAHNSASIEALASLGVGRVTLSRELGVDEIGTLVAASPVELECFVHGSLCVCHSGQCLMSSLIGGRSANRGTCAQPCRLPYALVGAEGEEAAEAGRYLLSTADLAGITLLPALVASGVSALKIEGRMKSPEYVATVVRVYRAALDRAVGDPDSFQVSEAEWDMLSEAFTRGFSEAYLSGIRGQEMMSCSRPNNRGIPLGRVTSVVGGVATIALDRALEREDVLEFWTAAGRHAQKAGEMTLGGRSVSSAPAGAAVGIQASGVRAGDRVFRVENAALKAAARRTFASGSESRRVPAVFSVRLRVGEPAEVSVSAGGATATARGDAVEPARTKAVTASEVSEHVGRLGGTPYEAAGWKLEIEEGAGIAFSALHALRREALERLDAERLEPWADRGAVVREAGAPLPRRARSGPRTPALVVAVSEAASVRPCLAAGADEVLLAVESPDVEIPAGATPLLPRVAHEAEADALVAVAATARSSSGNLGSLHAASRGEGEPSADWGLNAVNPWTVDSLRRLGARFVWASPELSGPQLAALVRTSPLPVGALVHGRIELMVTEHCVLQSTGECGRRCATCRRRLRPHTLRDRKGYEFPVRSDAMGRTHIYNSVPLDLSRSLEEIVDLGTAAVRLEMHTETPEEAARVTAAYRGMLAGMGSGRTPEAPLVSPSTTGHYYRGVR